MERTPEVAIERQGGEARILLSGTWTARQAEQVETAGDRVMGDTSGAARVLIDLTGVERLDTLGAWVVDRARHGVEQAGGSVRYVGLTEAQKILLREVAFHDLSAARAPAASPVVGILADVGEGVVDAGRDVVGGVSFLGAFVAALGPTMLRPARFRFTSKVYHHEQVGLRNERIQRGAGVRVREIEHRRSLPLTGVEKLPLDLGKVGAVDAQDVGPEQGEGAGCDRSGDDAREVEHTDSREGER